MFLFFYLFHLRKKFTHRKRLQLELCQTNWVTREHYLFLILVNSSSINQWLLIVSCQLCSLILDYQMIYHHHHCFHKKWTLFFSGLKDDNLESFFSYGLFFWNTEWNLGVILEWKQLTPVQTLQLLSHCYFFEEKKILFPMDAWGLTN